MRWWGRLICALATLPFSVAAQEHAHHAPQPDDAAARKQRAWEERLKAAPLAVGAALDAQGRLWLARTENRRLLVSRSDDGGRSFTPPVAVTPEPEAIAADGESRPKIAVAADGAVHVSWNQSLGKPMSGHIRYARSTDAGKTFSRPVILNDDRQEISHRFDALAIDGRGRVAAVWLDARGRDAKAVKGSPATGVGLYAAVSEDGGASFGRNRKLRT